MNGLIKEIGALIEAHRDGEKFWFQVDRVIDVLEAMGATPDQLRPITGKPNDA